MSPFTLNVKNVENLQALVMIAYKSNAATNFVIAQIWSDSNTMTLIFVSFQFQSSFDYNRPIFNISPPILD